MSAKHASALLSSAITIAALFSPSLAAAEFWSEFRGSTGQGHSAAAAVPEKWSADKNTGSVIWKTKRDVTVQRTFSFSTPLLIEVAGAPQVVSAAVIAYEPGTGREIWRCDYDEGYSVVPRPVFANGLVYVCTGFNTARLLSIRPDGKGDVTGTHLAWEHSKAVPENSFPIVIDDLLFMVDDKGIATCLDALSGEVHWQERLGGNFSASPIHADGKLYFPSEEGVIHVIEPSNSQHLTARLTVEVRERI